LERRFYDYAEAKPARFHGKESMQMPLEEWLDSQQQSDSRAFSL
jgi:hypothetical protein